MLAMQPTSIWCQHAKAGSAVNHHKRIKLDTMCITLLNNFFFYFMSMYSYKLKSFSRISNKMATLIAVSLNISPYSSNLMTILSIIH
jgi:hypothetical protein